MDGTVYCLASALACWFVRPTDLAGVEIDWDSGRDGLCMRDVDMCDGFAVYLVWMQATGWAVTGILFEWDDDDITLFSLVLTSRLYVYLYRPVLYCI